MGDTPRITDSSYANITAYHGPFAGDDDSETLETNNITRSFYCNQDSSAVHITFYVYECGDTESNDYIELYLTKR